MWILVCTDDRIIYFNRRLPHHHFNNIRQEQHNRQTPLFGSESEGKTWHGLDSAFMIRREWKGQSVFLYVILKIPACFVFFLDKISAEPMYVLCYRSVRKYWYTEILWYLVSQQHACRYSWRWFIFCVAFFSSIPATMSALCSTKHDLVSHWRSLL